MTLKEYFENTGGTGILGTADADGQVDLALYSRPHFLEEDDAMITFIMNDRLSYANIKANGNAAYMFIEDGPGYRGKRLYLTMIGEEKDSEKIESIRRRKKHGENESTGDKFLVTFRVDKTRPLVGG